METSPVSALAPSPERVNNLFFEKARARETLLEDLKGMNLDEKITFVQKAVEDARRLNDEARREGDNAKARATTMAEKAAAEALEILLGDKEQKARIESMAKFVDGSLLTVLTSHSEQQKASNDERFLLTAQS